jgi:hypothetical protein
VSIPCSRYVPSSGFLSLPTVYSTFGYAGLFRPAATSRVSLRPGVSPAPQPSRLVVGRCLRAVVVHPLTGKPAATDERLDFEALLCGPKRSSRQGLAAPSVAPLFGFLPPSGSHASVVSRAHPVVRS